MSIPLRGKVIDKGIILFTADLGELTEYFYFSTMEQLEEYRYRKSYV